MAEIWMVFASVFLAELGDKTQLATLLFATKSDCCPWRVFLAASLALAASSGLAVFLGTVARKHLESFPFQLLAGVAFILIGAWTLFEYFRPPG